MRFPELRTPEGANPAASAPWRRSGEGVQLTGSNPLRACFGETTGCLLVEVRPADASAFEAHFNGLNCCQAGVVCPEQQLTIRMDSQTLIDLPVDRLLRAWRPGLD